MKTEKMLVTNIQRFSLDDGPGIRTTVFLAGCNMRCLWCHNPEAFQVGMLAFERDKCIRCGRCEEVCGEAVHTVVEQEHYVNRKLCNGCKKCVEVCENKAIHLSSSEMSIAELMVKIGRDKRFYEKSAGGVTFSGGEPVLQAQVLRKLLEECKKKGINTAIETAGNYSFSLLEQLLEMIDLVIVDCKAYSDEIHQRW